MDHVDQKYIDALLNNNEAILREIYVRFGDKIRKMIWQLGGNDTDAADIMQDALLSILNRVKKRNFTLTCPFEGFLYLVCKRRWIKEKEKRSRLQVTIDMDEAFDRNDAASRLADDCMVYEERRALVAAVMQEMGEKCRQLLYLSWEGISMEEVAARLNMSYGYARKKKTGCMARLIGLIHQSPQYNSLK